MDKKSCKRQGCKREVTLYSKVDFCSTCQLAMRNWVEANPSLQKFNKEDVEFLFCHNKGCSLEELCEYLKITKKQKLRSSIKTVSLKDENEKQIKWVSLSESAKTINLKHNWITIYHAAKAKEKNCRTLHNYAFSRHQFFGPTKNVFGKDYIHISVLSSFETRWNLAERYFLARKHRKGKTRRVKDALKPWNYHTKLTKHQLQKKYCCRSKQVNYVRDGVPITECFDRDDVYFIDSHPSGCHLDELQIHLETSGDLFDYSVRNGKITVDRKIRKERRVFRCVTRDEMCRIISLMHNRIKIAQLAHDYKKDYTRILRLANQENFGPLLKNFSDDFSIGRCFAMGFIQCFEKATSQKRESWQSQFVADDEITSLAFSNLLERHHTTTDRWHKKGIVPGERKHKMIVFKIETIKTFILEVAAKKHSIDFSFLEPCLTKLPFCEDMDFLKRVKKQKSTAKNKRGGKKCVLKKNQYCADDLACFSGVKPQTARNWLRHFLKTDTVGPYNVTTLEEIKQFILGVLGRQYPVERCWVINIVNSEKLGPILEKDSYFIQQVKEIMS